jgi:uncharacterized membrane protein (UPF0127 family)
MEIINNGVILADNVRYCKDIFSKTRGLMFRRKLKQGQGLILVADEESIYQTTIHMMFVFFPIDVIWLNKQKEVVDIKQNIKSFQPLITPRAPAKYVLELPVGTAKNIKLGDQLKFV